MIDIKSHVANLVKKHGSSNPFFIADCLGIDILPFDLPVSICGFLVRVLRRKIIILNSRLNETSQNIVICHELGHARLHAGYGYYFNPNMTYYIPSKREREANEYAANLLSYSYDIDSDLVARIINDKRPAPKIIHRLLAELSVN